MQTDSQNPGDELRRPWVDVAVGVLIRPDGSFLIARRPPGKPMDGYWEFPGGKLEAGETVFEALRREFLEELDLDIQSAYPWATRYFTYPHANVRLHYWRSFAWHGAPRALEGQEFRWESIDAITTEPWLPGALPLKRWLTLPKMYAISNATGLGTPRFLTCLDEKLATGEIKLLQLREPGMRNDEFALLQREVMARARGAGCRVLVNSMHGERHWSRADGVHLRAIDALHRTVRPDAAWCAMSCHSRPELDHAAMLDLDFAVLGSVKPTATHPDAHPLGWAGFEAFVDGVALPVYALGGLAAADYASAVVHGAHGIASLSAAWRAAP